jgi:hypothetical protein
LVDKAKQRTEEHLIDADGERLLRASLPRHWVLREYRPDYGLDFALEVFKVPTEECRDHNRYETLGEHLFVQLKSSTSVRRGSLKLYGRHNVEKSREVLDSDDLVGETETIRFSLETTELVTIQRMGAAIPVLLVIADVTANRCFFVCLNLKNARIAVFLPCFRGEVKVCHLQIRKFRGNRRRSTLRDASRNSRW